MLKSIDQALAGAIDVIADDVTATVKSVKEQGMMRTLGDAVEDAAGLVASGAGSAISGLIRGRQGEKTVSNHSGLGSGYADIMSGGRSGGYAPGPGGGAAFPYVPNPSSGKPGAFSAAKAGNIGSFGPGIGIRLPGQGGFPGQQQQGGVQVFAGGPPPAPAIAPYAGPGAGAAGSAGAFRPPMPYSPSPAAYSTPPSYASSSAPSPSATGGKEPTIPTDELARRFEVIVGKEAANSKCFDCGSNDHEWASVSFGIFLCITCAGHHRQLGTHISRIRSCKMDSWTERQIQIFGSGGNKRLAEFFRANGVAPNLMYQRYATPAGDWYREAWIKNRTLGRPVPAPEQGVVVGPCVDGAAQPAKAKPAAPPADLLDLGGGPAPASAPASAAQADLLGFGGDEPPAKPTQKSQEADLLGVGSSGGGDLLSLGTVGGTSAKADDLLGLAATAASAKPAAASLASLDFGAAPVQAAAPQAMQAAAPAAQPARQAFAPAPGTNTLGGGAKLAEPAKEEKADDPFAMALKQWGM
eukprot:gb/GFBE01069013.1/.p1 GENE.gb/GFBE01069013.1/~~gb/GFBE01069013.1/.p1  ORF type:complete len:525 (+),score=100.81 gb/GFBE01069013.1/:1-1575(+)